jgi:hypothetical protein
VGWLLKKKIVGGWAVGSSEVRGEQGMPPTQTVPCDKRRGCHKGGCCTSSWAGDREK